MKRSERITLLTSTPGWYGNRSGYYEQLAIALSSLAHVEVLRPSQRMIDRAIGKAYAIAKGIPPRDQTLTHLEIIGAQRLKSRPDETLHVTNLEAHLPMFSRWDKAPRNLVATIHFPPSAWPEAGLGLLARCTSAIVLYPQDLEYFEKFVGKGRVKVVHHGVDLDFFTPRESPNIDNQRVLFCGQFLRDFQVLSDVVHLIHLFDERIQFDFVIPQHAWSQDALIPLAKVDYVHWHQGLTDNDLREVYWNSTVAIAPMIDCAANNAIVELLACGVPLVATDVGGIRHYGGGSIFPITPPKDATTMAEQVLQILRDKELRQTLAFRQRDFAMQNLSWHQSARQHMRAYEFLTQ